jgi:TolB-like protein
MIVQAGMEGLDRDVAAEALWSRSPRGQARTNLRQALANLRKALGPDARAITTDGARIILNLKQASSDVAQISELSHAKLLSCSTLFLEGLSLDEPGFEDWLAAQRAATIELLASVLDRKALVRIESGAFKEAIELTTKLVGLDNFHEESVRLHMQALSESGETAAALRAYRTLESELSKDLGVAPSEATKEQYLALTAKGRPEPPDLPQRGTAIQSAVNKAPTAKWPVLAVLPFTNLSSDPEQDYFSIGITEDIVARLSGSVLLSVAAQDTLQIHDSDTEGFKRQAQQHGINFLLTGSVRRADQRLRIVATLRDVDTNRQVWGANYDRDVGDIFDVQDEVSSAIAGVLPGQVGLAVAEGAARKPPSSVKAYEYLLQGKAMRDGFSAERNLKARRLFEKAVELDPLNGSGWGYLQDTYVVDWLLGVLKPGDSEKIYDYIVKSLELDPGNLAAHDGLGYAFLALGRWQDADTQFERTANMLTNQAEQFLWCGYGHSLVGRHEDALRLVKHAIAIDPLHPPSFEWVLGQVHFLNRDFEGARETLTAAAMLNSIAYAYKIVSLVKLGRVQEARDLLKDFRVLRKAELSSRGLEANADTLEQLVGGFRVFLQRNEDWELIKQGMNAAGLSFQ